MLRSYLNFFRNKLSSGILEEMPVISSLNYFLKGMLTCTAFLEVQPRISAHGRTGSGKWRVEGDGLCLLFMALSSGNTQNRLA